MSAARRELRVEVAEDPAARACALLVEALGEGGALLLSGGSTPRPVYAALARPPLVGRVPWERVDVFFADERCVPPDDPASNAGMARALLLDAVPARVHPVDGTLAPDEAARRYAARLPARFAFALLGVGADGHTASLFPGDPALEERQALCAPSRAPEPPRERVTLTLPALARADRAVFLVTGAGKADMVARARSGADLPATRVRTADGGRPLWLLDRAAAAGP